MTGRGGRQAAPGLWSAPNLLSLARLPLAAVFVAVDRVDVRLAALVAAAASDLLDGWLARRMGGGPSRLGALLDPVTDKVFMLSAFAVLAFSGALTPLEIAGVLLRDIIAPLGYLAGVLLRRPFSVPARAGGKMVTLGQVLTLALWLAGSRYLEPMAWATAAMAIYAIVDYGRYTVFRGARTTNGEAR